MWSQGVLFLSVWVFASGKSDRCGNNEFPCNDGQCIPKFSWCDSTHDCLDDSDEEYCLSRSTFISDPNKCSIRFFLCKDGPCIPLTGRCDGYPSCKDHSDEEDCVTSTAHSFTKINVTRRTTMHSLRSTFSPTTSNKPENYNSSTTEAIEVADVQSDTQADFVDVTEGFKALDSRNLSHFKDNAESWLLATRDAEYGWGEETARCITVLYLSNPNFRKDNMKDSGLMLKQLHLKIYETLIRDLTEPVPLSELALYVNALHAECSDPRNFHGHNLIEIMRHRTDAAQGSGKFISPTVYLTLCISNATTLDDYKRIKEIIFGDFKIDKIDFYALMSLAASCISSKFPNHHVDQQIARRMLRKVTQFGLPSNVYELALVIQAMNEAKVNQELWERSSALGKLITLQQKNGGFGDILGTYYALPLLSGKSYLHLSTQCDRTSTNGMLPLDVLRKGEQHFVQYSLYMGVPVEVSQTLRIKVSKTASILDVLSIGAATNPAYRFQWDESRGHPSVYSIAGLSNDAERGTYWMLHVDSRKNDTRDEKLIPFQGDIRHYIPSSADHIIFWFKRIY